MTLPKYLKDVTSSLDICFALVYSAWVVSFCHLERALFRFFFSDRFWLILEIVWFDIHALFCCFFRPSTSSLVFVHNVFTFSQLSHIGPAGSESYLGRLGIYSWLSRKIAQLYRHDLRLMSWFILFAKGSWLIFLTVWAASKQLRGLS